MASLSPHTAVLGRKNARHLIRRATFVYSKALINQFETLTPQQALDLLVVNQPLTLPLPYDAEPTTAPDGFWTESTALPSSFLGQVRKAQILSGWFWYNAINSATLKYKLSFFLSTRFTIEKDNGSGPATMVYDHLRLLMFYAYGNYKSLAKKMTLDNSMLGYLNNTQNNKNAPNENYAREFLELFTIGKGEQIGAGNYTNYTEADIVEAAKVLTGFKIKGDRSVIDSNTGLPSGYALFSQHKTGTKTFTSAFNNTVINSATDAATMQTELDTFVEMIFAQPATAKHICRKIYQYFVKSNITPEVETDIITPLATALQSNGYEILPIVRTLLESKHFYDLDDTNATDETIGAIIKSPIQQLSEMVTYLKATLPNPNTEQYNFYRRFWINFVHNTYLAGSNMMLFSPDSVAGHQAYYQEPNFDKNWISSSTLIARYRLGESFLDGLNRISGNANIYAKINIADVIKNGNIVSNPADPNILCAELMNDLFAQEPDTARITYFKDTYLLQGFLDYNWTSAWNNYVATNDLSVVEPRLKLLVKSITNAPEAQIF